MYEIFLPIKSSLNTSALKALTYIVLSLQVLTCAPRFRVKMADNVHLEQRTTTHATVLMAGKGNIALTSSITLPQTDPYKWYT